MSTLPYRLIELAVVLSSPPIQGGRASGRALLVAGLGGIGAIFTAGWAMSKVYKRKFGPL